MSTIFVLFSAFNKRINNLREKQDILKNMVIYLKDHCAIVLGHIVNLSENSINRCQIILTIMHMSSCKTPNSPNIQLLVVKVSLQTN